MQHSLQRHKTGRLPREKLKHLGPHKALAEHHPAGRIGPVRLKYPLRNIKPYRASLAHGRLPWWLLNTTTLAHRCRRGASTPSRWRRTIRSPDVRSGSDGSVWDGFRSFTGRRLDGEIAPKGAFHLPPSITSTGAGPTAIRNLPSRARIPEYCLPAV